jgi:hypothetical protein
MYFAQSVSQIFEQKMVRSCACITGFADQYVVPALLSRLGYNVTRGFAQATLGVIAFDCVANFFGTGVPNANPCNRRIVFTLSRLKKKAGCALASCAGSQKKVSALF